MSRGVSLIVKKNAVVVPALSVDLAMALDGRTSATVGLDPTSSAALSVNETDLWDLLLSYDVPAGGTTTQKLMTGARARRADYKQQLSIAETQTGQSFDVTRRITLTDKLAAFRDYGPDEDITREGTSSRRELAYFAARIGMAGAVSSLPGVAIDRIDYTRDQSYWDAIAPYFLPWDPLVVLDPDTGSLRLYDPLVMHASAPRSNRVLTLADYNPAEFTSDLGPIVTQVRVNYRDFGPSTEARPVSPVSTRTEEELIEEDDGTTTLTWTGYADLHDDPANPTTVTRSVVAEQGVTRTRAGGFLSSQVTAFTYERDYALLTSSLTIVEATVDLPLVGEYRGEVERTEETRTYEADTVVPGRLLLKRVERVTSGLYVYNFSDTDDGGAFAAATATPIRTASHNGAVDVDRVSSGLGDGEYIVVAKPTTSQQFATGNTRTVVETYQRNHATGTVTISGVETDALRNKDVRSWQRTEIGDNTVYPVGRVAYEYVDGSETYGERKAAIVDATRIGLPLGRQIAQRMLTQSGQPVRSARITLTRPDYRRYRLGWIVELDSDAPYSMAGLWFVRGVSFRAAPPSETVPPVVQELDLVRYW